MLHSQFTRAFARVKSQLVAASKVLLRIIDSRLSQTPPALNKNPNDFGRRSATARVVAAVLAVGAWIVLVVAPEPWWAVALIVAFLGGLYAVLPDDARSAAERPAAPQPGTPPEHIRSALAILHLSAVTVVDRTDGAKARELPVWGSVVIVPLDSWKAAWAHLSTALAQLERRGPVPVPPSLTLDEPRNVPSRERLRALDSARDDRRLLLLVDRHLNAI